MTNRKDNKENNRRDEKIERKNRRTSLAENDLKGEVKYIKM